LKIAVDEKAKSAVRRMKNTDLKKTAGLPEKNPALLMRVDQSANK
jgi:hypothetical protein